MKPFILIVDDEENLTFFLKTTLEKYDFSVDVAHTFSDARQSIRENFPDLVLLDLNLPDGNGLDLYKYIKDSALEIPTIIITAHGSMKSAIDAMKLGVDDYIVKPFELDELVVNIQKQLDRFKLNNQFNYYRRKMQENYKGDFFVSTLPQVQEIQNLALKIAQYEESTILIEGASGTGKEMLARFIHQKSPQVNAPFVEINCASLPENLLESELFGYEPGAFTDAKKKKIGLIELANGGTLFLDEISEMNPYLQAKILRVIETHAFKRLGGIRDIKVNLRIITATNRDIKKMVEDKLFRQDLFFRLNMFHIILPTLNERKEEFLLMVKFFLEKIAKKLRRPIKHISQDAQNVLLDYEWPGNMRELHNIIERAVILCDSDTIGLQHLPCEIMNGDKRNNNIMPTINDLENTSLKSFLNQIELSLLTQALQASNGNQLKAADLLGEPRHIVRYLMKKHHLTETE